MKRIEAYAVAILLALVPAVFGLWGNTSFSKVVPVPVPDQARATTAVAGVDTQQVQTAYLVGRTAAERRDRRHGADDPITRDGDDHPGPDRTGHRRGDLGGSGAAEPGDDRGDTSGSSGSGHGPGGADDSSGHGSGGSNDSGGDRRGSGEAEPDDNRGDISGTSGSGHGSGGADSSGG